MLRFCLVDVRSLVAYLLLLPLSYPKRKKIGEPKEESRNLYGFRDMNSYIQIHLYDFLYVNSYNLQIHIIRIVSSSLVHKGYFHGHDRSVRYARSMFDLRVESVCLVCPVALISIMI
jgi:hypothetical protein